MADYDPIEFARAEEQIRQEREAFNQQKAQDQTWFVLRLSIAIISTLLLCVIMFVCCYIFYFNENFPTLIVSAASAAFFGDILGLLLMVWKVVIGTGPSKPLAPVTRAIAAVD